MKLVVLKLWIGRLAFAAAASSAGDTLRAIPAQWHRAASRPQLPKAPNEAISVGSHVDAFQFVEHAFADEYLELLREGILNVTSSRRGEKSPIQELEQAYLVAG
ncbi:unnamed protein product, partial [Polarella glacialis]